MVRLFHFFSRYVEKASLKIFKNSQAIHYIFHNNVCCTTLALQTVFSWFNPNFGNIGSYNNNHTFFLVIGIRIKGFRELHLPYSRRVPSARPSEFVLTQWYVPTSDDEKDRTVSLITPLYPVRCSFIPYFGL